MSDNILDDIFGFAIGLGMAIYEGRKAEKRTLKYNIEEDQRNTFEKLETWVSNGTEELKRKAEK